MSKFVSNTRRRVGMTVVVTGIFLASWLGSSVVTDDASGAPAKAAVPVPCIPQKQAGSTVCPWVPDNGKEFKRRVKNKSYGRPGDLSLGYRAWTHNRQIYTKAVHRFEKYHDAKAPYTWKALVSGYVHGPQDVIDHMICAAANKPTAAQHRKAVCARRSAAYEQNMVDEKIGRFALRCGGYLVAGFGLGGAGAKLVGEAIAKGAVQGGVGAGGGCLMTYFWDPLFGRYAARDFGIQR